MVRTDDMKNYLFSSILYCSAPISEKTVSFFRNSFTEGPAFQLIIMDRTRQNIPEPLLPFKENIIYRHESALSIADAYNEGLKLASGSFVHFCLSDGFYSDGFFKKAENYFSRTGSDLISARPRFIQKSGEDIPYGGSCKVHEKEEAVDLGTDYSHIQLMLQAWVFKKSLLEGMAFDEVLYDEAQVSFLIKVLQKQPRYCHIRYLFYYYSEAAEDAKAGAPVQYNEWWYTPSLNNFIIPLLKSSASDGNKPDRWLQKTCMYLIYSKINCNLGSDDKSVLSDRPALDTFMNAVYAALTYIDNDIIMDRSLTSFAHADRAMRAFLLRGKAMALGQTLTVSDDGRDLSAVFSDNTSVRLGDADSENIRISNINYEEGNLIIEGLISVVDFLHEGNFDAYAISSTLKRAEEKTRYEAEHLDIYSLTKCFGVTYRRRYCIRVKVPVSNAGQDISFYYTYNSKDHPLMINTSHPLARLSDKYISSYWQFDKNNYITCSPDTQGRRYYIQVRQFGLLGNRQESLFCKEILRTSGDKDAADEMVSLRREWHQIKKAKNRKPVWVTFDKLYKAGDNGEYFFSFCMNNHADRVDMYYIIREDSPARKRLEAQFKGHILIYGSVQCIRTCLAADAVFATHPDVRAQFDPGRKYLESSKDLFNAVIICIQHGLTIQKIAQYQNRLYDNTSLYMCASSYEIDNLSKPAYGYTADQLKLTGLARYDGLKNNDKKIILITPTWRRSLANKGTANIKKTYNEHFKESTYFKIYNSLLNNERLIGTAKKNGYRILYLLHPALSAQLPDFSIDPYVEMIQGSGDASYEKILCESSLMVTDYSGVQFDFAYMRKPIIYFHSDQLPPHYESGGLDYDMMGFGPICRSADSLIDELCKYMNTGCITDPLYIKRADDFFAYDDHNNCERIYNEAVRYLKAHGKV